MSIVHLTLERDWLDAVHSGTYRISTRGHTVDEVGFIHCSTPAQVARVASQSYADVTEPLRLLHIDPATVHASGTTVKYEDAGNGELFPHIYGAIDPEWVIEAQEARIVNGQLVVTDTGTD